LPKLKELRFLDSGYKTLGQDWEGQEDLNRFDENEKSLRGDTKRAFRFWESCQAWDGAGSIKLSTVKVMAEDEAFDGKQARILIRLIENCYRRTQANG